MEHRRLICGDKGSESTDDQDGESSNHLESKELENVHEGWKSESEPYRMYPRFKRSVGPDANKISPNRRLGQQFAHSAPCSDARR